MSQELLNILLFADDIVLIADSADELQRILDDVHDYSRKWRFKFNVVKSGRRTTADTRRRFYLGLQRLGISSSYKYLGVIM